jgi:hypothetical protein
MTDEELIAIAKTSPALFDQSEHYPQRYEGQVPLKVKMVSTVTEDLPWRSEKPIRCYDRSEYYVRVNKYGAVTALLQNGNRLGLKPGEFMVVEWHQQRTNTDRLHDMSPRFLGEVRQAFGAGGPEDQSEDAEINAASPDTILETWSWWKLGSSGWWINMKTVFDELSKKD